ncbi:MAG: hypothetical protein COY73_02700 [Candidatus Nealsonbacteria bacterium CG_4_10_14_0_8_um_filter_37_14]|uniref:Uncharacterized protein n=1 Tax=Candidatus Nealsonbacteria bacterium CG_4_10_14_0_8_um_filter_37_14 TaxID=1974684 RepID=A0A2M7R5U5_9BACT|nr:MAG: hypothetical protein COY73_02700 [Candidatus Nealsonbacteria bacterium CG_4_10_14_0_8_um_filter_37_14]
MEREENSFRSTLKVSLLFPNFYRKEVKKMDEKRKGELALAAVKANLRKQFSLRDIANIKRNLGNTVKEPEFVAVKATSAELLEISKILLNEIFEEQMKVIS